MDQELRERLEKLEKQSGRRNSSNNVNFLKLMLLVGISGLVGWGGFKTYREIEFNANVTNYIKAASKANNPARARAYRERAVAWLEARGMTNGRTDILVDGGPETDVGEWYADFNHALVSSREDRLDLNNIPAAPSGVFESLALYPYNQESFALLVSSVLAILVSLIGLFNRKRVNS